LRGRACPVARIFHKSYYNQYFDWRMGRRYTPSVA
jgi:hypothetical protein